jgi:hypothetical protein
VKKTGELESEKEYTRGAMLDTESKVYKQAALDIIAVEEPSARDEGFEEEKLMEGDEEILCAILKHEDSED